mmetsp:Transcript_12350/g.33976  ORF Transcript_12350/g.33976 Transcript_12350/m.33976 type:complete len:370 (+) Transcript_12350:176-1285(+)
MRKLLDCRRHAWTFPRNRSSLPFASCSMPHHGKSCLSLSLGTLRSSGGGWWGVGVWRLQHMITSVAVSFHLVGAVVGDLQKHLKLVDQWEARVGWCALIVEGLLRDVVDRIEERLLGDAGFLECARDGHLLVDGEELRDVSFHQLFVVLSGKAQAASDARVALHGLRVVVPWVDAHAGWLAAGVVPNHRWQQDTAAQTVGQVERCAHLVRQRMVNSQEGVGECQPCQRGTMMDVLAGIVGAVLVGLDEVVCEQLQRLQRVPFCELVGGDGDEGFRCMGNGIDAGVRHEFGRKFFTERGVNDGDVRCQFVRKERVLHAIVIGNHRKGSYLRGCAGRCWDADHLLDLGAEGGEWARALAQLEESCRGVLEG